MLRPRNATPLALFAAVVIGASSTSAQPQPASLDELYQVLQDERAGHGLAPLNVDRSLERAAQSRARALARVIEQQGTRGGSLPSVPEPLSAALFEAGYGADRVEAMQVLAADTLRATVFEAFGVPSSFREALLGDQMSDLGVGVAAADGRPVYVFLLALSKGEAFARRTVDLRHLDEVRDELVARVNAARREEGLGTVAETPCLDRVAQAFAARLFEEGFFDHTSPQGEGLTDRLAEAGCRMREASENLASGPVSAAEAVEGWLSSPSHRRALLFKGYREVGHGIALGRTGDGYTVIWVQVLGRP
jgi:uncharacterized protein YkwD